MKSRLPVPFVVGVPRSGTTLLRLLLDAHPRLAIPPETAFIPMLVREHGPGPLDPGRFVELVAGFETWPDFHLARETLASRLESVAGATLGDGLRAFYALYAERRGKQRFGDKTPDYGLAIDSIAHLLPEARFLHIIRDPRAVAASVRHLWFSPSRNLSEIAADWVRRIQTTREQAGARASTYELRYEDLLADPESMLREICAFIDLDFDPQMLAAHHAAAARLDEHEGRWRPDGTLVISKADRLAAQRRVTGPPNLARAEAWRTELGADEQALVAAAAGPLLRALGYPER